MSLNEFLNHRWIADEWGPCTKNCGGGKKIRIIVCAEESNGNRHRVPDEACRGIPPRIEEACNSNECPKWVPTEWSGVCIWFIFYVYMRVFSLNFVHSHI